MHLFSALSARSYLDVKFEPGDALVFGRESVGLPEDLTSRYPDRLVGIPTLGAVRSLNLANAVGIGLYEALRQSGAFTSTFIG
jgi:tRNA (cytidine/uridine-2'-O-)-methyltransferase